MREHVLHRLHHEEAKYKATGKLVFSDLRRLDVMCEVLHDLLKRPGTRSHPLSHNFTKAAVALPHPAGPMSPTWNCE